MVEANKAIIRRQLRDMLAAVSDEDRHRKSIAACGLLAGTPEFAAARVVMLFLSMPHEIETSSLALRCWQAGKTVVVPKVSWDQRRMLPVEISSLTSGISTAHPGVLEPSTGKPMPVTMIDLVVVPGIGFTPSGHRIGRGMGFYDRFLAQEDFVGVSCGLGFEEQVLGQIPVLDHDMPLSMLITDQGIRRFASIIQPINQ
ncbi:MAG TPA: 5-formyltetrahydrofolate cyclo-ligase [Tepidisphaeraceae bacterium]|jgi:5-formyltetrahydrofolate cyclo-ligase|nr:5-formyltetrahydrofolate cyclo-ligase [Tepidisphaeraceae bacterium]